MNTLPIKLVNERLMFTIDYGDKLPWGSVITLATITVEVFSGEDAHPQRVFSQVWEINGTAVTFQVRQGLPGVIYSLQTKVKFNDDWLYRDLKLAVMPDHGDVGALYPLTRIFTSLPYVQMFSDAAESDVMPTGGLLVKVLSTVDTQPDNVDSALIPINGDLYEIPPGKFLDEVDVFSVYPTDGDLFVPPPAYVKPDKNTPILLIEDGDLFIPPTGTIDPDLNTPVLVPTGGELAVVGELTILGKLTSFWEMGESSGTRYDSKGSNHLTPIGTVSTATGIAGAGSTAVSFSGGGALTIVDNSSLSVPSGGGDHCMFGWMYVTSNSGTQAIFAKWDAVSSNSLEYALSLQGGVMYAQNGGSSYYNASVTPPTAGTWVFWVMWRDSSDGKVRIQVNNGTIYASTGSSNPNDTSTTLAFGQFGSSASGRITGRFQYCGWIKGAILTADQRTWLYNSGAGRSYADIVAAG